MINRRQAIKKTAAASALLAVGGAVPSLFAQAVSGPFVLPPLPYAFDALEPQIDAQTMQIHHDKHHAAYVANLNKALANHPDLANKTVEELVGNLNLLPEDIRAAIRNQGGGHANHSLFWQTLKKGGGGKPVGELFAAIEKSFGSFEKWQQLFTEAATKQFGSGWAWLTLPKSKTGAGPAGLSVQATANQDTPLSAGHFPLLGIDVWEHAYYLKYQNRRADYIAAFYQVINWDFVSEQYARARA